MKKTSKNFLLKEVAGISLDARVWTPILRQSLDNLPKGEKRIIIDCQDYPEQYKKFSVDYIVLDLNDWTNGYLDETSGYDKDGNYVVHIMVLEGFIGRPYMDTILNHEGKHAYQDWQRRKKGYEGIFATKEVKDIYTKDFIKIVKDKIPVSNFLKNIFIGYYLLTDLEFNAFMENVYDRDKINDYRKMVTNLRKGLPTSGGNEREWEIVRGLDLPFLKKYKTYQEFIQASSDYFKKRSDEIIRKLDKVEYVHGLNESRLLNEQILCHLVSPMPRNLNVYGTGYISNEEANSLINKIEMGAEREIKDPELLSKFKKSIQQFRSEIKNLDVNNDTIDTNLHKLRDLINC